MFAYVSHASFVVPAAGLLVAAASGVFIRARRAREDQRVREGFSIVER